MFIPHLSELRGQHVATSNACASIASRPSTSPRESGDARDVVIPAERGVESRRFPVYVNGEGESFASAKSPGVRLTLRRPKLAQPLYVGLCVYAQDRLDTDDSGGGVILIAGWDPISGGDVEEPGDYLFVVAR
jgi:hypothetical protein